jgi:uncharacterized membrane protein YqjE
MNDSTSSSEPSTKKKIVDDLSESASEVNELISEVFKLQSQMQQWSKSTFELFVLELVNSIAALKRIFVCHILFVFLLILFVVSLCIGVGVITYHFTASVVVSYFAFVLTLAIGLISNVLWRKRLNKFVGFSNTFGQIKEGANVFTQQTKKDN